MLRGRQRGHEVLDRLVRRLPRAEATLVGGELRRRRLRGLDVAEEAAGGDGGDGVLRRGRGGERGGGAGAKVAERRAVRMLRARAAAAVAEAEALAEGQPRQRMRRRQVVLRLGGRKLLLQLRQEQLVLRAAAAHAVRQAAEVGLARRVHARAALPPAAAVNPHSRHPRATLRGRARAPARSRTLHGPSRVTVISINGARECGLRRRTVARAPVSSARRTSSAVPNRRAAAAARKWRTEEPHCSRQTRKRAPERVRQLQNAWERSWAARMRARRRSRGVEREHTSRVARHAMCTQETAETLLHCRARPRVRAGSASLSPGSLHVLARFGRHPRKCCAARQAISGRARRRGWTVSATVTAFARAPAMRAGWRSTPKG